MFGGSLYPDLHSYRFGHSNYHNIVHENNGDLNFFLQVNSLHHQGLRKLGNYYGVLGAYTYPKIIAVEPNTDIVEIISWLEDRILGIQFHPEYYADTNNDKIKFREYLYMWAAEKQNYIEI